MTCRLEILGSIIRNIRSTFRRHSGLIPIILCITVLHGCGTLSTGRGWGQDATIAPGWEKACKSAMNAFTSPEVLLPAAGAMALQIHDIDGRISDKASAHNPVFGSQTNASEKSDMLVTIATGAYLVTMVAAPSGDQPFDWLVFKTKGFAVGAVAIGLTNQTTSSLKDATHRLRPDKSNYSSLPSSHASNAAVLTMLTIRNLDAIPMPQKVRLAADASLYTVSLGTGWARVEAQKHYPSDVLAGMALGNFIAACMYDTFMGIEWTGGMQPAVMISPGNIFIGMHCAF